MVQNSEHFSPLQNGSERNYENFLFPGKAGIPRDLWFPNQMVVGGEGGEREWVGNRMEKA
jgi:hypothetical protein